MANLKDMFCSNCGSNSIQEKKPGGDTHFRKVCSACDNIIYENPKVVVGSVCTYENKFLMCKRAIEPQKGLWTLPAGYLENNESVEEGAIREAYEEAYAKIRIKNLLAVYSLKHVEQIQILFHSELLDLNIKPGIESLEVSLFDWDKIHWDNIAFPSVVWALNNFKERQNLDTFKVFNNPI